MTCSGSIRDHDPVVALHRLPDPVMELRRDPDADMELGRDLDSAFYL